jgi:hypothetical protein
MGRLPAAGTLTLSPPKSWMSNPSLTLVVSPQPSEWLSVRVQSVVLPNSVRHLSAVQGLLSLQPASSTQLLLGLAHVLEMDAPC